MHSHSRQSFYCIIPPHMLDQINQKGTAEQKASIARSIAVSDQLRTARLGIDVKALVAAAGSATVNRMVYDAKNGSTLPGTLVRQEGDPPVADVAVNEAYDYAGATYDLYKQVFNRNSIDNNGLRLDSTVHYQKSYDNAFWNGSQMVYGDGDEDLPVSQRIFNRFTISIDVIGHELTHGVTQHEANLNYVSQSGALNESMSDVFGSLVKQHSRSQSAAQADWIIGEGLFTANVNGVGIRSMKAPGTAYDDPVLGKDPQPAHMKDYVTTVSDNGGVHINSGIPNHAFYLLAMRLGGNAWEKPGQIWYKTLTDKLTATSNFQDAADLTFQAAGELFGINSLEQDAVKASWADVGITVGAPPSTNPGCLTAILRALGLAVL